MHDYVTYFTWSHDRSTNERGDTSRRPAGDGGEGNLEVQNAYPGRRTFEQWAPEQNRELVEARVREVSV